MFTVSAVTALDYRSDQRVSLKCQDLRMFGAFEKLRVLFTAVSRAALRLHVASLFLLLLAVQTLNFFISVHQLLLAAPTFSTVTIATDLQMCSSIFTASAGTALHHCSD